MSEPQWCDLCANEGNLPTARWVAPNGHVIRQLCPECQAFMERRQVMTPADLAREREMIREYQEDQRAHGDTA